MIKGPGMIRELERKGCLEAWEPKSESEQGDQKAQESNKDGEGPQCDLREQGLSQDEGVLGVDWGARSFLD